MSGDDELDLGKLGRSLRGMVELAADAFDAAGHPHGKRIREQMARVDEKVKRTTRDAGGALGKLQRALERISGEKLDDEDL